jgi:PAS domain-containing protein
LFDRLHAREAAKRSEAELSTVYDRVPSVLCLFDEDLQIVRANHAAIEFASHCRTKKQTVAARGIFPVQGEKSCRGGCQPACLGCHSAPVLLAETLDDGQKSAPGRMTKTLMRHGQQTQVVLLVSTERIQFHNTVRVLMCLEDITKNVRADEQIRSQAALLDITRDAIFVRDFSDRVLYWNDGAHALYGWPPAEAMRRTSTELLAERRSGRSVSRALAAVQLQRANGPAN